MKGQVTQNLIQFDEDQDASAISDDGTTLKFKVPKGWYDGNINVKKLDANFSAGNIKTGVNLFGKTGTFLGDGIGGTTIKPFGAKYLDSESITYKFGIDPSQTVSLVDQNGSDYWFLFNFYSEVDVFTGDLACVWGAVGKFNSSTKALNIYSNISFSQIQNFEILSETLDSGINRNGDIYYFWRRDTSESNTYYWATFNRATTSWGSVGSGASVPGSAVTTSPPTVSGKIWTPYVQGYGHTITDASGAPQGAIAHYFIGMQTELD